MLQGAQPTGSLIGRSADIRRALAALRTSRLVTITGPGGVGKTRLAQEVATRVADSGRATWMISFRGMTDAELLPGEVCSALGVSERPGETTLARLVRGLHEHDNPFIALDNLEQIRDIGPALSEVVAQTPHARILVTSRVPLMAHAETEVPLAPLQLPEHDDLDEVIASPACALFLARAMERGVTWDLEDRMARDVARLCRRLDGIPLALELAARRARVLTPGMMLRRLEESDGHVVLTTDRPGVAGHESLDGVIGWSLDLLRREQFELLMALSTYAGTFDLQLAEAISDYDRVDDSLDALVSLGLVRVDVDAGESRFRMLETIRAVCRARLDDASAERLSTSHASAIHGLIVAESNSLFGQDAGRSIARLEQSLDDIRLAFDWLLPRDTSRAIEMLDLSWRFWSWHGRIAEAALRTRAALALLSRADLARARALVTLTHFIHQLNGPQAALDASREAVRIARRTGDRRTERDALMTLAMGYVGTDPTKALPIARRLLALSSDGDTPREQIRAMAMLGEIELVLGHVEEGRAQMRLAIEEAQRAGLPMVEAVERTNLAEVELYFGAPEEAARHSQIAAALFRSIDGGPYLIRPLAFAACSLAITGRLAEAREPLIESLEIAQRLAIERISAHTLVCAIPYLCRAGQEQVAARSLGWIRYLDEIGLETLEPAERAMVDSETVSFAARAPGAFGRELARGARATERDLIGTVRDAVESTEPANTDDRLATLTPREREVVDLLAQGYRDREIAAALGIATKTASVHVSNARAKLGAETRVQAALAARGSRSLPADRPTKDAI